MTLILPPNMQKPLRPYAAAATIELIEELGARDAMAELSCEKALPQLEHPERLHAGFDMEAVRQATFAGMFQEVGQALLKSDYPFTGRGFKPPATNEYLTVKLLIIRHPLRPLTK